MNRSPAICTALLVLVSIGCGPAEVSKAPQMQPSDAPEAPRPEPSQGDGANVETDDAAGSQSPQVVLDQWGDFPKDVFFDDPFAELGEEPGTNLEPASDAAPEAPERNANVKEVVTAPPAHADEVADKQPKNDAAEGISWAELISTTDLVTEINELRLRLANRFSTLAEYNANYRSIRVEAGVLAVLAGIAAQHEGAIPWKSRATQIRDAAVELAAGVGGLGDQHFTAARNQYAKVRDLMDQRSTNDEPNANPIVDMPWSSVAARTSLMQRMKLAQDERIKPLTASEGEFRRNSGLVAREAGLLAALAEVTSSSYDFCDDEVYQTYIRRLRDQSRQLSQAAREFDFARAAELARANLKICNDCHVEFRFGELEF